MAEPASADQRATAHEGERRSSDVPSVLEQISKTFAEARDEFARFSRILDQPSGEGTTLAEDTAEFEKKIESVKKLSADALREQLVSEYLAIRNLRKSSHELHAEKSLLRNKVLKSETVLKIQNNALLKVERVTREALKGLQWREKQLRAKHEDLKADLQKSTGELSQLRVECSRLRWQKDDLESRVDDLNKASTVKENQLSQLADECAHLRQQLAELATANDGTSTALNGHMEHVDGMNGHSFSSLETEQHRQLLAEKIEMMRLQAEEYERSSREMKVSLERLRVDIVSTEHSACQDKYVQLDRSLRTDLESQRRMNKTLMDENAAMKEQLKQLQSNRPSSTSAGPMPSQDLLEELREFVEWDNSPAAMEARSGVDIAEYTVDVVTRFFQGNHQDGRTSTPVNGTTSPTCKPAQQTDSEGEPPTLLRANSDLFVATDSEILDENGELREGAISRLICAETPANLQPTREVIIDEDSESDQLTPENERIEPFGQGLLGALGSDSVTSQHPATSATTSAYHGDLGQDHSSLVDDVPHRIDAPQPQKNGKRADSAAPKAVINESFEEGELKEAMDETLPPEKDVHKQDAQPSSGRKQLGEGEKRDTNSSAYRSRDAPSTDASRKSSSDYRDDDQDQDFKRPSTLKRRDSRHGSEEERPWKKARDENTDRKKDKPIVYEAEKEKEQRYRTTSRREEHESRTLAERSRSESDRNSTKVSSLPRIPKLSDRVRNGDKPRSSSARERSRSGSRPPRVDEDRTQALLMASLFNSSSSENVAPANGDKDSEAGQSAKASRQLALNQALDHNSRSDGHVPSSSSREKSSEKWRSQRDASPPRTGRSRGNDASENMRNKRDSASEAKHAADRNGSRRGRSPPSKKGNKSVDDLFDDSNPNSPTAHGSKSGYGKSSKKEPVEKTISQGLDKNRREFYGTLHSAKLGMYLQKVGQDGTPTSTASNGKRPTQRIESSPDEDSAKASASVVNVETVVRTPKVTPMAPRKMIQTNKIQINIPSLKKSTPSSANSSACSSMDATPVKTVVDQLLSPPPESSASSLGKMSLPAGVQLSNLQEILNKLHK